MQGFCPLYGVLIYLQILRAVRTRETRKLVFVPSTEFLFIYTHENLFLSQKGFSSPQRGSYLSTVKHLTLLITGLHVFVPSTGFLFIYKAVVGCIINLMVFSSPQRGSYLSTVH